MHLAKISTRSLACFFAFAQALALAGCGGADIPPAEHADGGPDARPPVDAGPDARLECPTPEPTPANCDFFLSCGCNVAGGEKCSIEGNNKGCFQRGTKQVGQDCTSETDCVAGSLCAVYGAGKRCMQFCDNSHACKPTAFPQACYIKVNSTVNASVCGQLCDLRTQNCEFADQGCYPSTTAGSPEKGICVAAKTGGQGDACTFANDCKEGFTCSTADQKCHQLCDRAGGAPTCTTGTCSPLSGHTATGICQ